MTTPRMAPEQLRIGTKVEMEHTDDPEEARRIARDHLREFPDYYTRLVRMEARAKAGKLEPALAKAFVDWFKAQQLGLFGAGGHAPAGGHGAGKERPGHKYIKREGSPGHYEYTYPEDVKPELKRVVIRDERGAQQTDEERVRAARAMGERAFAEGKMASPAMDATFMGWLAAENRNIGEPQTVKEMKAWGAGWVASSLKVLKTPAPPEPTAVLEKPVTPEREKAQRLADQFQRVLDLLGQTSPEVQEAAQGIKVALARRVGFLRSGVYDRGGKDYEGLSLDDRIRGGLELAQRLLPVLDKPKPVPEAAPVPAAEPDPLDFEYVEPPAWESSAAVQESFVAEERKWAQGVVDAVKAGVPLTLRTQTHLAPLSAPEHVKLGSDGLLRARFRAGWVRVTRDQLLDLVRQVESKTKPPLPEFQGAADPGAVPVTRFTIGGEGTRAKVDADLRTAAAAPAAAEPAEVKPPPKGPKLVIPVEPAAPLELAPEIVEGPTGVPEGKSPGRLERSGDHIWGARRDLVNKSIKTSKDLEGISFDDAAKMVSKAKLVPKLDLQQLRDQGLSPGSAHMCLALLATIQAKPSANLADRAAYVDKVNEVLTFLPNCKTLDNWDDFLREMHRAQRQGKGIKEVALFDTREEAEAEAVRLRAENPEIAYRAGRKVYGRAVVFYEDPGPYAALGRKFLGFLRHDGNHRAAYTEALTADNWWDKGRASVGSSSGTPVEDGWKYLEERGQQGRAQKAINDLQKKKVQEKIAEKGLIGPKRTLRLERKVAAEVTRNGGTSVPDANPERARRAFNLREVDFGQDNYMAQGDRAYHVKAMEGALHDLAEVLGVDPEDVSFNGRLGVALGARGAGKARAHYETGRFVVNITKFRGGGALAHEWGHALDNILTLPHAQAGAADKPRYVTSSPGSEAWPDDLRKAASAVMDAVRKHPDPGKARAEHAQAVARLRAHADDLVSQSNTLVREANGIQGKALPEQVEARIFNHKTGIEQWSKLLAEEKARPLGKRGRGADAIQNMANWGYWIENAKKKIAALQSGESVRKPEDDARFEELTLQVEALRQKINPARDALSKAKAVDPTASRYYRDAHMLGSYWRDPQELFARAFESYIQDELAAKGRESTYLVDGTQDKYATASPEDAPSKYSAEPYPQGAERENINRAMREFVGLVRQQGLLKKALAHLDAIRGQAQGSWDKAGQPSGSTDLTPEKARKILRDGG